jgi:hypothetical protein
MCQTPLVGAGGEPVDLRRTMLPHDFVELPPMRLEQDVPALEVTLTANGRTARTVARLVSSEAMLAKATARGRLRSADQAVRSSGSA